MPERNEDSPLARALREARESAGLTLGELERRSGVSRPQIYRIETGASPSPGVVVLGKLARALDINVEVFYEAHWKTNRQPLPDMATYLRNRHGSLTKQQIAHIEQLVAQHENTADWP